MARAPGIEPGPGGLEAPWTPCPHPLGDPSYHAPGQMYIPCDQASCLLTPPAPYRDSSSSSAYELLSSVFLLIVVTFGSVSLVVQVLRHL